MSKKKREMEEMDYMEQESQVSIEEIRKKRKQDAEAMKAAKQKELNQRDEFRKFFAKKRDKLKLDSSMEHILWLHFLNSGFAQKEKFEDGLKHFGIHN